jgi:hypothetical protein
MTELYELVGALPDESLPAAAILLRRAQDPVIAKLDAAPYDDEEVSEEDLRYTRLYCDASTLGSPTLQQPGCGFKTTRGVFTPRSPMDQRHPSRGTPQVGSSSFSSS